MNTHRVKIVKTELRTPIAILEEPGRARKMLHLIWNIRLLFFCLLPICPSTFFKKTETHPPKTHRTMSGTFYHCAFSFSACLLLNCQLLDAWTTPTTTSRPSKGITSPGKSFGPSPGGAPSHYIPTYIIVLPTFMSFPSSPRTNHP